MPSNSSNARPSKPSGSAGKKPGSSMDAPAEAVVEVANDHDSRRLFRPWTALSPAACGKSRWRSERSSPQAASALILEAMKMEVPLEADEHFEMVEMLVAEGASVRAGQALVIVKRGGGFNRQPDRSKALR